MSNHVLLLLIFSSVLSIEARQLASASKSDRAALVVRVLLATGSIAAAVIACVEQFS